MARHRNIRAIDVDEEYDGYYSCYGHSVEDDFCISPRTEAQFLYNRSENQPMAAFLDDAVVEEDEDASTDDSFNCCDPNSQDYKLSSLDTAKLQSCVEAMQDVVGDTVSDIILRKAAFDHNFNLENALNAVLLDKAPKSQRKASELLSNKQKQRKNEICLEVINESSKNSNIVADCEENKESDNDKYFEPIRTQVFHADSVTDKFETEDQTSSLKYLKQTQNVTEIYKKERGNDKPLINLVVIGHVDAGKSTLMGHLLYRLGQVSKRTMHKFEQDSKKLGKASFMFAWVLDETPEERNRGITMDVAQSKFETAHRSVVLLDAPGHKDFIPNMITGAAQADVAILVVDSTRGEFETGFETGGQTREHTMLIRSLGVSQVAIAVNKMDNVNWDEERFKEVKSKMSSFLKTVGFKENDVIFVPCSGLTGENLVSSPETPELKCWYSGSTLLNVIDKFQPPERPIDKSLRMSINDVFKGVTGGFSLAGKIESGFIKTGDKVLVMPAGEQGFIKGITIDDSSVQHAFAGDQIITQISGIDITNVLSGSMVCDIERPVKVTSLFESRLVIFNVSIPITKGFPVILHYQSMSEQVVIKNLISQLNRSTGEVIRKRPRCLTKNSSAVVEIEVNRPICIELFKDFKDLGRFMLRYAGSTIAAGLVTNLK